jgi:hypothetical protein
MFQQRQVNDIEQLLEISFAQTVSPGPITSGSSVNVTVTAVLGSIYGTQPGSCVLGDQIEVVVPAGAAPIAGVQVQAQPTGTPGQVGITFLNSSGSTVTPTSANYTLITKRYTKTLI